MNGSRLKAVRTAAGLSLRDLAEKIGNLVSAQAIGKYERGEMAPGSTALIALARALDVSENYLLGKGTLELVSVDYRKKASAGVRDQATMSAKVLAALENYLVVEEILGLDGGDWRRPEGFPFAVRKIEDAEEAAIELRKAWNLGTDAIPNLTEILEEKGIKIIAADLPADVSGMLCHVKRNGGDDIPIILLNKNHKGERQRFSLAHELGHLVMRVLGIDEEKACHRFAGAFLMDAEVLRREVGKHRVGLSLGELFSLKAIFLVSVQAIAYRCRDLGIIGPVGMRQLFIAFSKHGWRTPPYDEPQAVPSEVPRRFVRLCLRALTEGLVSESRAAELMGKRVRDLQSLMDEPPEDH